MGRNLNTSITGVCCGKFDSNVETIVYARSRYVTCHCVSHAFLPFAFLRFVSSRVRFPIIYDGLCFYPSP